MIWIWRTEERSNASISVKPSKRDSKDGKSHWCLGGSAFGEGRDARIRRLRIGRGERLKIDSEGSANNEKGEGLRRVWWLGNERSQYGCWRGVGARDIAVRGSTSN